MSKTHDKTSILDKPRVYIPLVWILRVLVGATFAFAGFSKVVDPWGFVFKIQEYLAVWGIDWLWREAVSCIAVAIAMAELMVGFMLLTGCLRRASCILALMLMAVMLPLTAYIAIVSPVSDCGCFGDAYVISNTATFGKNVVITAACVFLLFFNRKVAPLYPPLMQWMPMTLTVIYGIVLAFIGITIQPVVDFRPFKVGSPLVVSDDEEVMLLYQRDGVTQAFSVDQLPDSTWTYVGRQEQTSSAHSDASLAIYDGDDDVSSEVLSTDGPMVLLVVPDITYHRKSRASMANNINDYMTSHGGTMIGLIGTDNEGLEFWRAAAKPKFEAFTADDTTLKSLVRGDAGLVYVYNDTIRWKRNIFSLSGDFPDFNADSDPFDAVTVIDSGRPFWYISACYFALLLIYFLLGLIRIKNNKKKAENQS